MQNMQLILFGVPVVPLIMALVQAGKEAGMPSRFAPILSIVLGALAGVASQAIVPNTNWIAGLMVGIGAGLAAGGVFSGVSAWAQPKIGTTVGLQPINPPITITSGSLTGETGAIRTTPVTSPTQPPAPPAQ